MQHTHAAHRPQGLKLTRACSSCHDTLRGQGKSLRWHSIYAVCAICYDHGQRVPTSGGMTCLSMEKTFTISCINACNARAILVRSDPAEALCKSQASAALQVGCSGMPLLTMRHVTTLRHGMRSCM